jgi:hypothetical protein
MHGMPARICLIAALWTFVASPSLCVAGVLSHACLPHTDSHATDAHADDAHGHEHAATCESAAPDESCGHGDPHTACPHESDCSSDPCNLVTTQRVSADRIQPAVVTSMVVLFISLDPIVPAHRMIPFDQSAPIPSLSERVAPLLI